jgi:prophage regulatory protein
MTSEFQFYRVNELTKILSVSRASIYNWLNKGTFPKPIKISDSVNVWRASDIQKWVNDKEGEDIINE